MYLTEGSALLNVFLAKGRGEVKIKNKRNYISDYRLIYIYLSKNVCILFLMPHGMVKNIYIFDWEVLHYIEAKQKE